jgi:hypothetical protein
MRIRPRHGAAPLLLLLLPALTAALSVDSKAKPGSVEHLAQENSKKSSSGSNYASTYDTGSAAASKPDAGTKDAPVDGQDGKPHAGPFVATTKKKPLQEVEDLADMSSGHKDSSEKALADGWELPEDDGVMSDVADRSAVTGPTGTEGGFSQKERERKEKGSSEKKPDPPKEVPGKKADGEMEKKKGAVGIEVGRHQFLLVFFQLKFLTVPETRRFTR